MTQVSKLKILVLGAKGVGKSAFIVRVLTRRYIGEYQSDIDILYKKEYNCDESSVSLKILDISSNKGLSSSDLHGHIFWANGFTVLYDLCDKESFKEAEQYLELITSLQGPAHCPIVLLANKRDLEQGRQVTLSEGRSLANRFGCKFFEVSVAESYMGVSLSFDTLVRESISHRLRQSTRSTSRSTSRSSQSNNVKKLSIITVTKVFGAVFGGKHGNNNNRDTNSGKSVYFSNIDLVNSNNCANQSDNNNKENKIKKCVPLLNSKGFSKSKKPSNATMIRVARKASPPIISL